MAAINGTAIFLITYLILQALVYIVPAQVAAGYDFQVKASLLGLKTDPADGKGWYHYLSTHAPQHIIYTYAVGPFLALFIALVAKYFHANYFKRQRGYAKWFALWFFFHGLNMFFGAILAASAIKYISANSMDYGGFLYAIEWFAYYNRINRDVFIFLSIISIIVLIAIGMVNTRSFLATAPNKDLVRNDHGAKFKYAITVMGMPWLLGNLIIFAIRIPDIIVYDILMAIAMGVLMIIPAISFSLATFSVKLPRDKDSLSLQFTFIVAAAVILISYRLIFGSGFTLNEYASESPQGQESRPMAAPKQ